MPRRHASRWFSRALTLTLGLLAFLLLPSPYSAHAQADAAQEARVLFDAGVGASGAERWAQAREYFKASLALSTKVTTLLNLAVAEVKLGLGHDAIRTLDAFDRVADPAAHGAMIERARALRVLAESAAEREAEGAIPFNAGTAAPASAATGTASEPSPTPSDAKPASVGPHDETLSTARTPTPDSTKSLSTGLRAPAPPSLRLPRLLLAGGGVSIAIAVAGGVGWYARANSLERCASHVPRCDNGAVVARERNIAASAAIVGGAGALGLFSAGVVLLLRDKRERRGDGVRVAWSGQVLTLVGGF